MNAYAVAARGVKILPITPAIAADAVDLALPQGDPADRLIGATARRHGAVLLTCDDRLLASAAISTLW